MIILFIEQVKQNQLAYASRLIDCYDFGQRGVGDGNESEQLTGMIGQTVMADLLGVDRPDGRSGFDGGVDFFINDCSVDVKTMTRTTEMRDYYVHNFIGYQRDYDVDYYVFLSYNKRNRNLTICGYVDKETFFKKADFYPKGSKRFRSDGSCFFSKAPLYEIKQSDLFTVDSIDELIEAIG